MIENLGDKANTNGFDKNPENATKGGRRPSIKRQLIELIDTEGEYTFEKRHVIKVFKNGSVKVKVPTQMQIAMKLHYWAMSRKGTDSIKAIQIIMDQIDGKAKQSLDITSGGETLQMTPEERNARIDELIKKRDKK